MHASELSHFHQKFTIPMYKRGGQQMTEAAASSEWSAGLLRSHDGCVVDGSSIRAILGSLGAHVGGGLANWRAEQVGLNGRCAEVDAAQHPRTLVQVGDIHVFALLSMQGPATPRLAFGIGDGQAQERLVRERLLVGGVREGLIVHDHSGTDCQDAGGHQQ